MHWYTRTIECYPDCFCSPHDPFGILFWSSGAYFLSSFFLYFQARKKSHECEFWVFCVMTLAISSFLFHSTLSQINVALDYASIIMTLIFFPLWKRMERLSDRKKELMFFLLYVILWAVYLQLSKWFRIGLSFLVFLIVLRVVRHEVVRFRFHRNLQASVILAVVSFAFFLLDELRICQVNGHAIWHVGSAVALYFYGKWRFEFED